MTRFVVDAGAVLEMAAEGLQVAADHELLAPTLVRSQVLSKLHEQVHDGELSAEEAHDRLAYFGGLKMRLLGDAVLRRVAWEVADQLGWASTYDAEYIALTKLQADALVTLDVELARRADGLVEVAPIEALLSSSSQRTRHP
jgi:predicted nucleic acid-binding protein